MKENVPDSLIDAFERHYDTNWNDPALRNERLAWRAAWASKPDAEAAVLRSRVLELETQLEAIGAGGVEPLRKAAPIPCTELQYDPDDVAFPAAIEHDAHRPQWLTVVYRNVEPGEEARTISGHPKASAFSWSHAIHDRDAAIALDGGGK